MNTAKDLSTRRSNNLSLLLDDIGGSMSAHASLEEVVEMHAPEIERYVLLEKSTYDGSLWVSTWEERDDAVAYHYGQEYPADWTIEYVYDLDTGDQLTPNVTTVTDWIVS